MDKDVLIWLETCGLIAGTGWLCILILRWLDKKLNRKDKNDR